MFTGFFSLILEMLTRTYIVFKSFVLIVVWDEIEEYFPTFAVRWVPNVIVETKIWYNTMKMVIFNNVFYMLQIYSLDIFGFNFIFNSLHLNWSLLGWIQNFRHTIYSFNITRIFFWTLIIRYFLVHSINWYIFKF